MKNSFLYSFLFFVFISCSDDVKFNNPTLEGQKDNVFWRAIDSRAYFSTSNGTLSIEGYTRNEKLTLKTDATLTQTYILGTSNLKTATYALTDTNGTITFTTGLNIGNGEIVINEYDIIKKTVTGTFKFNANNVNNNPLGGPTLNFQYGRFYKVPVTTLP
jgi:hypothetical protein